MKPVPNIDYFFKNYHISYMTWSKRFLCLFMLGMLSLSGTVMAQEANANGSEPVLQSTPSYIIGFIFNKLAGTSPDFDRWADVYTKGTRQKYGKEGLPQYLSQTRQSFEKRFQEFDVDAYGNINVVLPAIMEVVPFETRYLLNITFDPPELKFLVKETPDRFVNFVIPDLEDKLSPLIEEFDYKNLQKSFPGINLQQRNKIRVLIQLKPVSADGERPFVLNDKQYWLMLTEFVTFEIWDDRDDIQAWRYISEEERMKSLNDLRSLYAEPETKTKDKPRIYSDF